MTAHTLNPKGVRHEHINTGREPLWPIVIDGPHGDLPRTAPYQR